RRSAAGQRLGSPLVRAARPQGGPGLGMRGKVATAAAGALAAFALLAGAGADAGAQAKVTRYSIANGCFEVRSAASGAAVAKQGGAYVAGGSGAAEPFRMRPTTLGRYLLYDTERRFLAAAGQ